MKQHRITSLSCRLIIARVISICFIFTITINYCDTRGTFEKAKETWLRNLKNEMNKEREYNPNNKNNKGVKPKKQGQFFNKNHERDSATIVRGCKYVTT